jgi:hypothetical protein
MIIVGAWLASDADAAVFLTKPALDSSPDTHRPITFEYRVDGACEWAYR